MDTELAQFRYGQIFHLHTACLLALRCAFAFIEPVMARVLFVGGQSKSFYSRLSHSIKKTNPDVVAIWTESFLQGRAILRAHPDFALTILDLTVPDGSGLISLFQLRSEFPTIPILVSAESCELEAACRAIAAGAAGYIFNRVPSHIVARNILAAIADDFSVPLLLIPRDQHQDPLSALSPQQLRVFDGLKRGLRNYEIASQLGITVEHLEADVGALYRHLEITSHTQVLLVQLEDIVRR